MRHSQTIPLAWAALLAVSLPCAAKPSEWPVALQSAGGLYVTARAGGSLVLGSGTGQDRTTFTLLDQTGGTLANGDPVQIQFGAGRGSTHWREVKGDISRVGGRPDKTGLFHLKWKQPGKLLQLQTASGKYVSAPAYNKPLYTAAATDPATIFTVVKNPAPQEARQKATPKKAPAKPTGAPASH